MSTVVPPRIIHETFPLYPLVVTSQSTVGSGSNTPFGNSSFQVAGDSALLGSLFFSGSSLASPSTSGTRSQGTRLVLKASTGSGTYDSGMGMSSTQLWTSSALDIAFYPQNTSTPVLLLGNGTVSFPGTTTTTGMDSSISSVVTFSGDVVLGKNIFAAPSGTLDFPSTGSTRSLGTRLVLAKRTPSSGTYESALGVSSSGTWVSSASDISFYTGTVASTKVTSTGAQVNVTTAVPANTYVPGTTAVSLYAAGDIGSAKSLFLKPTATAPTGNGTRSSGMAISLSPNETIGVSSSGTWVTSSSSTKIYYGTSSVSLAADIGASTYLVSSDSSSMVKMNPNSQDIIGAKSAVYSSIPNSPQDVTGLAFSSSVTRYFKVVMTATCATSSESFSVLYQFDALLQGSQYMLQVDEDYDSTNRIQLAFSVTSGGQVQVACDNITDFVSLTLKFTASTIPV